MDGQATWGALLPLWIIGAPMIFAWVQLARLPKRSSRQENYILPERTYG